MTLDVRFLYPREEWIPLLKACLVPGAVGRSAWHQWVASVGDPASLMSAAWAGAKRWWPLLWTALHRNRLQVARDLATPLKSAYAAEMIRYTYCRQIAGEVLSRLRDADFGPVLLKGMALAEAVYARPALRHCHELDVLIRTGELTQAAETVGPDFRLAPTGPVWSGSHVRLVHRSGLPLLLRTISVEDWFNVSSTVPFVTNAGLRCHIFTPEYTLWHVCYEAGRRDDFPFAWISDGWHLLTSSESLNRELLNTIVVRSSAADVLRERINHLDNIFGLNS